MQRKLSKHHCDWNRLSNADQQIIPEYQSKLTNISKSFQVNQGLFDLVVKFSSDHNIHEEEEVEDLRLRPTDRDYENLRSTLRQLVREWSLEGAAERSACFTPIIHALLALYNENKKNDVKILVPGAGLGRLAWEISRLGFSVQGNEFSLYMLLTSQLILNHAHTRFQYPIIPFAFPLSNHLSESDSLRIIRVPDVTADTGHESSGDLSMIAGDFLEVYGTAEEASSWDCVVTCFFLDTAQNIIEYLRVILAVLKPGGLWINLGPLQYHFESAPELSIELTWEEVVRAAERLGFVFNEKRVLDEWMPYAHDLLGLSKTVYRPVLSVASKKL